MIKEKAESELSKLILNQTVRLGIKVSEANWSHRCLYSFDDQNEVANDFMKPSEGVIGKLDSVSLDQIIDGPAVKK